jgi:hypothetical protein
LGLSQADSKLRFIELTGPPLLAELVLPEETLDDIEMTECGLLAFLQDSTAGPTIELRNLGAVLLSWSTLMERSLIWSALGRMSKQGLLPMPIEDISAILTAAKAQG